MANDLARALAMPIDERLSRYGQMIAKVRGTTSAGWADTFLAALDAPA